MGNLVGFYQKWLPEIPIAMTLAHAHKGRFGDEVLRGDTMWGLAFENVDVTLNDFKYEKGWTSISI